MQKKIDATILGIVWHPEVRPLSDQCKNDIAVMIRELATALTSQPAVEDRRDHCYWYGGDCGQGESCSDECYEPATQLNR